MARLWVPELGQRFPVSALLSAAARIWRPPANKDRSELNGTVLQFVATGRQGLMSTFSKFSSSRGDDLNPLTFALMALVWFWL